MGKAAGDCGFPYFMDQNVIIADIDQFLYFYDADSVP